MVVGDYLAGGLLASSGGKQGGSGFRLSAAAAKAGSASRTSRCMHACRECTVCSRLKALLM